MSGHYFNETCPNCGNKEMEVYSDTNNSELNTEECLKCGYTLTCNRSFKSLKEVNEIRKDRDLRPLKKLRSVTA